MSSPTSPSPRGTSRGKRAAERPPSRLRRTRKVESRRAARPSAEPKPAPKSGPPAVEPRDVGVEEVRTGHERPRVPVLVLWFALLVAGTAALGHAAVTGLVGRTTLFGDLTAAPPWLDGAGAVAVVTSLSWFLATRTGGRPLVAAGLALVLGVASVVVGGRVLPTGAAVLTCAVGSVYAVMVTVPAITWWKAMREALVATVVALVTALAVVGFEPTVGTERFEFAALVLALGLALTVVYRLGAGLHGLGRRGLIVVAIGTAVLVLTLAYAELLRRYGAQGFVSSILDFADETAEVIGAFPRPLVVLLGVPAIVWGCHVRARRRQGWWVCAFGVAATVPMASGLVPPDSSYLEAALRVAYSLVLGLVVGYLVIRADLALTGPKGRRGRRAEEAGPHRPEPSRFAGL